MQNQLKTMLDAKLLQVDMRRFMHLVPYLQFKKCEKKKTHGGALFFFYFSSFSAATAALSNTVIACLCKPRPFIVHHIQNPI